MTVDGGYRDGIPQSQVVKLVEFRRRASGRVALVDAEHHRLAAFLEHHGHVLIVGRHPGVQIGHQDDDVRLVDGQLGLPPHLGEDHIVGMGLDAPGVCQHEGAAAPFARGKDPIPGHAGRVLDDGQPLPDELIEQCRFSHIGTPYHRHYRPRHRDHHLSVLLRLPEQRFQQIRAIHRQYLHPHRQGLRHLVGGGVVQEAVALPPEHVPGKEKNVRLPAAQLFH